MAGDEEGSKGNFPINTKRFRQLLPRAFHDCFYDELQIDDLTRTATATKYVGHVQLVHLQAIVRWTAIHSTTDSCWVVYDVSGNRPLRHSDYENELGAALRRIIRADLNPLIHKDTSGYPILPLFSFFKTKTPARAPVALGIGRSAPSLKGLPLPAAPSKTQTSSASDLTAGGMRDAARASRDLPAPTPPHPLGQTSAGTRSRIIPGREDTQD